jgi:hypothetical protein
MTSDGFMESVHPTQLRWLLGQGLVFAAGDRWRTELTGSELAASVADIGVCDFCSRPRPEWAFPCADFERAVPGLPAGVLGEQSIGAWGACERCALLIRTGRYERLAARAIEHVVREHHELAAHRDVLARELGELFREFAAHRTGEPVRTQHAGSGDATA